MISLFESDHFRMTDIIRTGKKNTAGNLELCGLDGKGGDPRIICAVNSEKDSGMPTLKSYNTTGTGFRQPAHIS